MAVGGGGTVHLVLGALAEFCEAGQGDACRAEADAVRARLEDFTLVMLPIGSGNDFLRSHNVPKDHEMITDMMAAGSFALQDVVRVELLQGGEDGTSACGESRCSYLANIGGYNFDANVCDKVNVLKAQGKEGKLIYVRVLFALAGVQKAHRTRVMCDGVEVFDDRLYTISIGNGRFSGGGLCQTPSAVIDDGMLNIMVAPVFPLWKLSFYIGKLFRERTEEIPFLHFFNAKVIEIIPSDQGQLVEVDGEVVGRAPVRFSVLEQQINVLHRG